MEEVGIGRRVRRIWPGVEGVGDNQRGEWETVSVESGRQ
jgi:hypothetical protein